MTLDELFDNYSTTVFRLETLPTYKIASEQAAVSQFLRSGTVPFDYNIEWLDFVREEIAAGKSMQRLRLVHEPLTDYERFELTAAYPKNVNMGEDIRIAYLTPPAHAEDFWAFDNRWVVHMNYSASGEYLGSTVADLDEAASRRLIEHWLNVFASASSLSDIM